MKSSSALFLQGVVLLVGLGVLGLMLWEPHLEGRNVHATTFEIYFNDPFLAYAYLGSIPFFVALLRIFRLLRHVRRTGTFSEVTLNDLRVIKRCAIAIVGFVAGGAVFIIMSGDGEDRPAGVFMCALVASAAGGMAIAAALAARTLQGALRRAEGRQV